MITGDIPYDELRRRVGSTYSLTIAPREIAGIADTDLQIHRSLVRDIFRIGDAARAAREIGVDHVYRRDYWSLVRSDLAWEQVIAWRCETILDMRANGITEPVEMFFDDSGVVFHGYHRLAVALELGIERIPAHAHALGGPLHDLATRVFSIYTGDLRLTLYQPIDHPCFRLFPVQQANADWDAKVAGVADVARDWTGEIVEVGAHFGMLTRALRQIGLDVAATDIDQSYVNLQPLFEAIGLDSIPYRGTSIQQLAETRDPGQQLIIMGLAHHLLGKPSLWADMQRVVLPWMQRCVDRMVVEMSLLANYQGEPAACPVESHADVQAFWQRVGFSARRLRVSAMGRATYLVERR